jgi:hypothetical protein
LVNGVKKNPDAKMHADFGTASHRLDAGLAQLVTFDCSTFKKMIQGETVILALSGVKAPV